VGWNTPPRSRCVRPDIELTPARACYLRDMIILLAIWRMPGTADTPAVTKASGTISNAGYHGHGDFVRIPRLDWGVGMAEKTIRPGYARAVDCVCSAC
jgi:hypothetical protein